MDEKNKIFFNQKLLDWYSNNKRLLSFRKDKDPYKILVSEIMAQQTQIATMEDYFNRFITYFPTIHDLAQANEEEVISLWEGLGYYSRAKNLWKTSKVIDSYGSFPTSYQELIKLPGIGPYTAGAILSIAFDQKIPSVDGNALRVFTRLNHLTDPINLTKTKNKVFEIITEHLELTEEPGDFNQAIMELGALVCTKTPECSLCPVSKLCLSYKLGDQNNIPFNTKKIEKVIEYYDVLILLKDGKPLYNLRDKNGLLAGLNGFPMKIKTIINGSTINQIADQFHVTDYNYIGESKHIFSHKIWISSVFIAEINSIPNSLSSKAVSVPTAFKKMLKLIE